MLFSRYLLINVSQIAFKVNVLLYIGEFHSSDIVLYVFQIFDKFTCPKYPISNNLSILVVMYPQNCVFYLTFSPKFVFWVL